MRFQDIRRYLKPYSITASRTTTISHAFASAIATSDAFDVVRVRAATQVLDQDPDAELSCVYCGAEAETWDHVHATVKDKLFSGYGHRIGNLLPCCKHCNSKKGNMDWRIFLTKRGLEASDRIERERRIQAYLDAYCVKDDIPDDLPEYQELQDIRRQVTELFKKADELAAIVRSKSRAP